MADYRALNRANWDNRVPAHVASPDYAVARFRADPGFLSDTVRFDLALLGDVAGLRGVHLQCHIGTDTVSLARLGASMTGLDFSAPAVAAARELAAATGADATFVQSDVYAAAEALEPASFDLVYASIGSLCWLPDAARWARVVAALLRPGGRLFMRDGHPVLSSLQYGRKDGLLVINEPYFETAEPMESMWRGTYATTDMIIEPGITRQWNHGLGDVVTGLLAAGLTLTGLTEHDSVPWNALPGQMVHAGGNEWRLAEGASRMACTYTVQAVK